MRAGKSAEINVGPPIVKGRLHTCAFKEWESADATLVEIWGCKRVDVLLPQAKLSPI